MSHNSALPYWSFTLDPNEHIHVCGCWQNLRCSVIIFEGTLSKVPFLQLIFRVYGGRFRKFSLGKWSLSSTKGRAQRETVRACTVNVVTVTGWTSQSSVHPRLCVGVKTKKKKGCHFGEVKRSPSFHLQMFLLLAYFFRILHQYHEKPVSYVNICSQISDSFWTTSKRSEPALRLGLK